MDPRIILAGQLPDTVGAMGRGTALAAAQNEIGQRNALASLYAAQGPGIMSGDPQALNALSRLDPFAGQEVQQNRLGMDATRQDMAYSTERMQMDRDEAKRQTAAALAEQQGAIDAAEVARLRQEGIAELAGVTQAWKAGPEAYAAWAAQDEDWAGVPYEQAAPVIAQTAGALDALSEIDLTMPEAPSMAERYRVVGNQLIDLQAEGGPRAVIDAPGQTETIFGPDGLPIVQRGPAGGKPFTEAQGKDNVFATRAEGALAALDPVSGALTSRVDRMADAVPLGLARGIQSDQFQLATQAGGEFLQAILRKDTGAAITEPEQELYGKTYLPQPGDGPAVLEAKRESRARAVTALRSGMDARQDVAVAQALVDAAKRIDGASNGTGAPAPKPGPMEIDGFTIEEVE